MEEAKGAIARVRDYGETLKSGAPHQTELGADLVIVADLATMSTQPATPPISNAEMGLRDEIIVLKAANAELEIKLADSATKHAELSAMYSELVVDHDRLTNDKVELAAANKALEEKIAAQPQPQPQPQPTDEQPSTDPQDDKTPPKRRSKS